LLSQQIFFGIVALTSAASWAFATILWRKIGEEISPFSMNISKGILGVLYLAVILLIFGTKPVDTRSFLFLGASGLLGITIGDTLFFISLMHLGPRLSSLMGALTPVFIALSSVVFLREKPSFLAWVGIFLTVSGVSWALWERTEQKEIIKNKFLGITYRLLSIVCFAAGTILAKIGVESVPPLQATFIRLSWAVMGLILWGCINHQLKDWLIPFKNLYLLRRVSYIVLVIVFGGFWLSLIALKYINASMASTLNSTAPLFILPMAAIMLKEKISIRSVLGAVIAVCGVALIFIGG